MHTPIFQRMLVFSAVFLLAWGCGDDPEKKSSNVNNANNANNVNNANNANNANNVGNNGMSFDTQQLFVDAACEAAFDCPTSPLTFILGRYSSVTECKAESGAAFFRDFDSSAFESAVADGRITLDTSGRSACTTALKEALCEGRFFDAGNDAEECESLVTGNVPEGSNCVESQECSGGLRCERIEGECYGTCQPNCGEENCSDEQYCETGSSCTALKGEGEECFFGQCADGLYCREQTCAAGGDVAPGGECNDPRDCQTGSCINDVCVEVNAVGMGQECDLPFGGNTMISVSLCQGGLACGNLMFGQQGATGTCITPKLEGAECNYFAECAVGLTCDAMDPVEGGNCVPVYANGENCTEDFDCESNDCSDGVCTAQSTPDVCELP